MAEANHRLPQILDQAHARITTAAHLLAQLRARQAVKRELQKQGLKASHYSAKEISSWGECSSTTIPSSSLTQGLSLSDGLRKECSANALRRRS
jgi:hypothetical protein